jgi:predicted amidohydrolase
MKLTISLAQFDIALGEPEKNWATVQRMTAVAAQRNTDILVLPELWSTGYDLENAATYATPINEGIFAQTSALAKEHNIAICERLHVSTTVRTAYSLIPVQKIIGT